MIVQQINNHVQQALNRLLEQYRGLSNFAALITSLVTQIQDLENALYPLDQYRQLQFAYGAQLDGIGDIVGLKRNGLSDAEYFIFLIGAIAENNSDTTANTMITIILQVFQATSVFYKNPASPGLTPNHSLRTSAFVAYGVGSPLTDPSLFPIAEQIVQAALGAGISLIYLSTFNSQNAISTAGPQAWCRGCSDLNNPQPTDGVFASLIYNNTSV